MARKVLTPSPGLFKNGARWWLRLSRPAVSVVARVSTGTGDTARANAILAMRDAMQQNQGQWEWLQLAAAGTLPLDTIYAHYAAGSLHHLRAERAAVAATLADPNLDEWVTKWVTEHVPTYGITAESQKAYARQVRYFIPEGTPFPASTFTEDVIKLRLSALTGARHDRTAAASSGTKRRYLAPLHLFIRYARRRGALNHDPLDGADWLPANGSPRSVYWTHEQRLAVLEHMTGEHKAAAALVLGTGIELGALLALKHGDVGSEQERTIVAHGTKNGAREDRTIFVDQWAWDIFHAFLSLGFPNVAVFSYNPANTGRELRDAFYAAQVAAGFIGEPGLSGTTRKKLWGRTKPHTIHDCRHTYAICRALGLDGELPQGTDFLARQLGHADEQMVIRVYKKANVQERLRLLQAQRVQQAAKAAGAK